MKRNKTGRILAMLLLLALPSGCAAPQERTSAPAETTAPTKAPAREGFSMELLSTGKSDCAILYMDGLVILSDTADEDDYNAIAARLRADGVERIDYLILSHYDKDHIGSAASLIRGFEVGTVLRPDFVEESGEYYALIKAEAARSPAVEILTKDYSIQTEYGRITVDPPDEDYGDDNNNSAITTVTYRGHNLLFMGDARKKRIEELLLCAQDSYDFIKLPHHGEGNKALYSLLRRTAPKWCAETISNAEVVEPELLELIDKLGIKLFCTMEGPIRVEWNGQALTAVQNP